MKIRELMSLELFKSCKLLTNDIGLENDVDSAMVLEALDIENWSRKNQLILTSFYAFQDLSEAELTVFFQKMENLGVSGIVVKMDRLITMIPDWLIALCFQHNIPLIKVEQDVSYEKIMLTIYEPLLNHQEHLLRTYYDVRQRFTKLERNQHSFSQIMDTFYELIALPCSLKIPDLEITAQYGPSYEDYRLSESNYLATTEFTKNHYEQQLLLSPDEQTKISTLSVKIPTRFKNSCTLTVFYADRIEEAHMMILENVIDILYARLQTEYLIKKDRYARLNHLADSLLQNTPASMDELNSLLDEAQMNRYPYYQGLAFSVDENNAENADILQKLASLRTPKIFFEHYHYTVILYNLKEPGERISKTDIQNILKLDASVKSKAMISISRVKEKPALKDILLECLDTIRFNQQLQMGTVLSVDELGLFRYFMQEDQSEQLELLIHEPLKRLQQDESELFQTLYAFFQNNRNYKKTAEALFLHPKTIRYRLNKIQQLLMIEQTNPLQLVNFEIATYLLKARRREAND
ncbi:PucR family transcriptional regulator [Enterococcus olivae]